VQRLAEGEGWEIWLDREGYLWTKVTLPQHGLSAAARADAMSRLLRERGVPGVIVDARRPMHGTSDSATEAYAKLVAAHAHVPFAVVTSDTDVVRMSHAVRAKAGTDNLRVFKSVPAAKAWIEVQRRMPPS
jgi:hypothetical protein